MTLDQALVSLLGLALIAVVVWFFWLKRTAGVSATQGAGGVQEVTITVKGGYTPDTIIVRHGLPVRLNFLRQETAACSEKVVFADFGKVADLPPERIVPIEFTPDTPGEYGFACGMGMLHGKLIVE